jgi:hypothetical protein
MLTAKGTPATAASQVAVDQEANTEKILRTPAGFSLKISHKNIGKYLLRFSFFLLNLTYLISILSGYNMWYYNEIL